MNEPEHVTFASYESTGNALGLENAWECTVNRRRNGHKTRLATRQWGHFVVHTVIATPLAKPTRKERGCWMKETTP